MSLGVNGWKDGGNLPIEIIMPVWSICNNYEVVRKNYRESPVKIVFYPTASIVSGLPNCVTIYCTKSVDCVLICVYQCLIFH